MGWIRIKRFMIWFMFRRFRIPQPVCWAIDARDWPDAIKKLKPYHMKYAGDVDLVYVNNFIHFMRDTTYAKS